MSDTFEMQITDVFHEVFLEQHPQDAPPELNTTSVLLETGLDSLGFAILVVRLEEMLGFDPFVLSTEAYYPKTFGEFVEFYRANQPR